jgi:hypothetical protein
LWWGLRYTFKRKMRCAEEHKLVILCDSQNV